MHLRTVVPLLLAVTAVGGLVVGSVLPGAGAGTIAGPGVGAGPSSGPEPDPAQPYPEPPTFATMGAGGGVAAENQPQPAPEIDVLAPGDTPPQFVVVSFDGACKDELFQHYLSLGERTGSRFTFFLSGLCLLPETERMRYDPPGKPTGTSAIGFAEPSFVPQRIANLTRAYLAGHEVGTHFLGHFCDDEGVGSWDQEDWRSEIEQFNTFLDDWAQINGVTDPTPLPFNATAIKGGRTPCLAGQPDQMYPVFRESGYTYDASRAGKLRWPGIDSYGLWEFPLQTIQVVGYGRSTLSMDYNFLASQNGADVSADAATCKRIRKSTYQSYLAALAAVHDGNRAPLFIGNHFNTWVCGAYRDALTDFVEEAHERYPEVRFVSNLELQAWLEAQDPAVLADLQARPAQEY